MNRFKACLLVFMMLWLPIKGVLAVAMPVCMEAEAVAEQQAVAMMHEGCHGMDMAGMDMAHGEMPADHHAGCDHCMNCYLSVAPFLTVQSLFTPEPVPSTSLMQGAEPFLSHIPSLLDRPPLA